jgi:hypothetical protein
MSVIWITSDAARISGGLAGSLFLIIHLCPHWLLWGPLIYPQVYYNNIIYGWVYLFDARRDCDIPLSVKLYFFTDAC